MTRLRNLGPTASAAALATVEEPYLTTLEGAWGAFAHDHQCPPPGDWTTWLLLGGRGAGKTRAGAEWVREVAETHPDARIALVGAALPEVRAVMVEGESGLLAISPLRFMPDFEPSLRRPVWPLDDIA